MLRCFTTLFVIDEASKTLVQSIGIENTIVTGDTRYDRVSDTAQRNRTIAYVESFKSSHRLFIAGSTWPEDEDVLIHYIHNQTHGMKFIIAPHEIGETHLSSITEKLTVPFIRYSSITEATDLSTFTVLIIDNVGMLAALYTYGDVAYVGGAFKQGLHNILEPLSFGLPVLFGPSYKRFPEACLFVAQGGAFSIEDGRTLKQYVDQLLRGNTLYEVSTLNRSLIAQHIGATDKIINSIHEQAH
jgi:3-deoxy-D-manno-octulosonic-acid transferase